MVFGTLEDQALWTGFLKGRRRAGFSANTEISYQAYVVVLQQLNVAGRNTMLIESCRDGCVVPVPSISVHPGVRQRRA